MERRRVVGAVVAAVIGLLVIVAVAAGGSDGDHHGDSNERAAAVEPAPVETTSTAVESTTTTAKPVAVAMAPCAVNGSVDPYFVVCGPASVKSGERAKFELVARGHIRDDCGSPTVDWGDRTGTVVCTITCDAYPADERAIDRILDHTYPDPGVYTLRFVLQGCGGPGYQAQAEITMDVEVH